MSGIGSPALLVRPAKETVDYQLVMLGVVVQPRFAAVVYPQLRLPHDEEMSGHRRIAFVNTCRGTSRRAAGAPIGQSRPKGPRDSCVFMALDGVRFSAQPKDREATNQCNLYDSHQAKMPGLPLPC